MSVDFAKQSEMSRISMQHHRERQQDELSEETQVHTLSTQMRMNEFNGDYLQVSRTTWGEMELN